MAGQQGTLRDTRLESLPARLAVALGVLALLALIFSVGIREALAGRVASPRLPGAVELSRQRTGAPTEVLRVATDATYWPMESISGTQIIGYDIDLMNALGSRLGIAVVYTDVPWKDIFAGLNAGQYDAVISTVSVTPERDESVDFSLPYVTFGTSDNIAIAVQQGNDALRRQLNEGLRALRAAGALDTIIAGISVDAPQWQPHLPAWPCIYLPFVIRN
jgi:ABC-type amino acid transport substrate-binding protein